MPTPSSDSHHDAPTETACPPPRRRRRFSSAQWRAWLDEHAASGLTAAAFCRSRELPLFSFYAWKRRLGSASTLTTESQTTGDAVLIPAGFVRLEPTSRLPTSDDGQVEVRFDCRATPPFIR